ncbi:MAG: hypothetical protein ACKV2V_15130, partial [Blastocatellia bacterium]
MNPESLFINPANGLLRGGWRALIYMLLLVTPYTMLALLSGAGTGADSAKPGQAFEPTLDMILSYALMNIWLVFAAWLCLRLLEKKSVRELGFGFYRGWGRDVWLGIGVAALMMTVIVGAQMLSGGTRL